MRHGVRGAILLVGIVMGLLCSSSAWAASGVLTWTANTEVDLAGYKIYRGTTVAVCAAATTPLPALVVNSVPVQVGKVTTYTDASLPAMDGTLCWEISAVDTAVPPNESGHSNRVSKVVNGLPPMAPVGLGVAVQ